MNINDKDFESNIKPDTEACEKPDKVSSQREKACFMKGLWSGIGIAVFSLAVATVLFLAVTGGFFKRGSSEGKATPSVAELDYGDINSKLKRIGKLIEDEYLYVEDTDAEAIESGIFKGFMYSLGDLYADYYSPEEFEDETANSSGNYCGIGVLMTYNAATNTITVVEVYEGSPAEEAGILEGDVLTIPAHEMKKRRIHRVPLVPIMQKLLDAIKAESPHPRSGFIFPSERNGSIHLSSQALAKFLHSTELKGKLVGHGLRSVARGWMADQELPFEACEACLAHVSGSSVSRAYQRSDYLDTRRRIMTDWCSFVCDCARTAGFLPDILENDGLASEI